MSSLLTASKERIIEAKNTNSSNQFKSINQNIVLMFCSQVSLIKEIITSFLSNVKYAQENEKEFIQNDLFDLITKLNDFKEMCLDKVFYMTDKL